MPYAYTVTVTGVRNYSAKHRVDAAQLWPFTQMVWSKTRGAAAALAAMGTKFFQFYPTSAIAIPKDGIKGLTIVTPNAAGKLRSLIKRDDDQDRDRYFIRNDLALLSIVEMPSLSDTNMSSLSGDSTPAVSDKSSTKLYPSNQKEYGKRLMKDNMEFGPGFVMNVQMPSPLKIPKS